MENKVAFNKHFYDEHWRHAWKHRFMYDPISKRKIARYVLRLTGFLDGNKSVLDVGFGFGIILFTFDRTDSISGIELAESAVVFAREKSVRLGFKDPRFYLYSGEGKLTLAEDAYDLVICSHVLEHVPDDHFLLDELRRVLKPGGIALLNIPINEEHFPDPRHMRKYTAAAFLRQVEDHGFKILVSHEGDKLWNVFGWFFEKDYHNKIPIAGFIISSFLNIFFSSIPFSLQRWFEAKFLRSMKPRQFAVCATK